MSIDIDTFIQNALTEDIGKGDITTLATIPLTQTGTAQFIVKENCTIAGIELAVLICKQVDVHLQIDFKAQDGDTINANTIIGSLTGSVHSILKAERLLLNCMQRMSAIATKTNYFVKLLAPYHVQLLDTRKTTPNFRVCEKWAVKIGGGVNHRFGLYDQILIKDNHIKAAGGIANALQCCEKYMLENNMQVPVIVEVKNEEEFLTANECIIVNRILLDNFKPIEIQQLLSTHIPKKLTEASGGINIENIEQYAQTGVNYVSLGDLTHHVSSVDISLKIN